METESLELAWAPLPMAMALVLADPVVIPSAEYPMAMDLPDTLVPLPMLMPPSVEVDVFSPIATAPAPVALALQPIAVVLDVLALAVLPMAMALSAPLATDALVPRAMASLAVATVALLPIDMESSAFVPVPVILAPEPRATASLAPVTVAPLPMAVLPELTVLVTVVPDWVV